MYQGYQDRYPQQNNQQIRFNTVPQRQQIPALLINNREITSTRVSIPYIQNRVDELGDQMNSYSPISTPSLQQNTPTQQPQQYKVSQDNNILPLLQSKDAQIQSLIMQIDAIQSKSKKDVDISLFKLNEYEGYVELLEKENKNLQYELSEISNHLNSYKDRFEDFQKFDHKSNKETNEYLCNQIERLTDMLKQKNLENQDLQRQLSLHEQNESKSSETKSRKELEVQVQTLQIQLQQYKQMITGFEQGQDYVKGLKERSQKQQTECQSLRDQLAQASQQEEFWKQLYNKEMKNEDREPTQINQFKGSEILNAALKNQEQRSKSPFQGIQEIQAVQPKTTKAKLQWKVQNN